MSDDQRYTDGEEKRTDHDPELPPGQAHRTQEDDPLFERDGWLFIYGDYIIADMVEATLSPSVSPASEHNQFPGTVDLGFTMKAVADDDDMKLGGGAKMSPDEARQLAADLLAAADAAEEEVAADD